MNVNKLKIDILDNIFTSYTRQGFGRLLKSEVDLIMFDFSLKIFFVDKKNNKDYFVGNEINYFVISKQDIYDLSIVLKITESKIIGYIEQIGLIKGLLHEELALPYFIKLLSSQKQTRMEDGLLVCYIPNKLVKSFIETKIVSFGGQPDYSFNPNILSFDLVYLLKIYNKEPKDLAKYIESQNDMVNNKELKKVQKQLVKKDIDVKEVGKDFLKTIGSAAVGKSSELLVENLFDYFS